MTGRSDPALHASLAATLLLCAVVGPGSAAFYMLIVALPGWYIAHEASKSGVYSGHTVWFPLTVIFGRLAAAFSFGLLVLCLYYADGKGGLAALLTVRIHEATLMLAADVNEQTLASLQTAAEHYSFLVVALFAWMWSACLYLHGWAVCHELARQKKPARPDMMVTAFPPPNWMISLLLLAALASVIGSPSLAFWGKASMVALLLPYFLLGLALIHEQTKKMQNRGVMLFFMYLLMAVLLWPVLLVSGYGLFHHIILLNKYLSSGGNSSKH